MDGYHSGCGYWFHVVGYIFFILFMLCMFVIVMVLFFLTMLKIAF